MRFVQKVLCLTQILDLLHTYHICMDLTCIEIKTKIWFSFSSFIKSGSVLPQQKYLAMALLSEWNSELLKRLIYVFALLTGAVEYTNCFSAEG